MSALHNRVMLPDLQISNMASVVNMIRKCGGTSEIISSPDELRDDCKLILAGVGAFDAAMRAIRDKGWQERLDDLVLNKKRPVLGICLGMQMMAKGSEEGSIPGLSWIDADVHKFRVTKDSILKVPHMGWNTVSVAKKNELIDIESIEERFYFVHSYHVVCNNKEDVLAKVQHGGEVTAALSRDNIFGVQFHPEKSHRFGMEMIKNFLELEC